MADRPLSRKLTGRNGLGLFDVCPTRDEGSGCTGACGQTLNKPPGTKPRNAVGRVGWVTRYGELKRIIRAGSPPVRGGTILGWRWWLPNSRWVAKRECPVGGEMGRDDVLEQQDPLGIRDAEADGEAMRVR